MTALILRFKKEKYIFADYKRIKKKLVPCPFIGPKLFRMSPNCFGHGSKFIIKVGFGLVQKILDMPKTILPFWNFALTRRVNRDCFHHNLHVRNIL